MRKVGGDGTRCRLMKLSTPKKILQKKNMQQKKNQETWRCLASNPAAVNMAITSVATPGSTDTKQYCPQSKKNNAGP